MQPCREFFFTSASRLPSPRREIESKLNEHGHDKDRVATHISHPLPHFVLPFFNSSFLRFFFVHFVSSYLLVVRLLFSFGLSLFLRSNRRSFTLFTRVCTPSITIVFTNFVRRLVYLRVIAAPSSVSLSLLVDYMSICR